MVKFLKRAFDNVGISKPPKPKPADDGAVVEMTTPMPEVGVGVPEHLAAKHAEREEEDVMARRAEMKQREVGAKRSGQWAEQPAKSTPLASDLDEIRNAFPIRAPNHARCLRENEEERQRKRDRGVSM